MEIQRRLAALRTDLDSFSDLEALALMASAYAMTTYELPRGVPGFPAPAAGPIPWSFQVALDSWLKTPVSGQDERLKLLDVGQNQAFKLWRVDLTLKIVAGMLGMALLAAVVWASLTWLNTALLTVGDVVLYACTALIGIVFGATVVRILNFPRQLTVGLGAGFLAWLAVKIHLGWIDPRFLQRGRLHLRHDQTLAWIRANQAWRRVKKTGRVYARALTLAERHQAFPSADGIPQRGRDGDVLCVGVAGEPWFQPLEPRCRPATKRSATSNGSLPLTPSPARTRSTSHGRTCSAGPRRSRAWGLPVFRCARARRPRTL